jgi:ligand-binding SRPBCC domain-containing protein
VDEQVRGPYRSWRHEHEFRAVPGGTEIVDRVGYALPLGVLGRLAHALFVRRRLQAIFDHREAMVERILIQDSTGEEK